MKIEDFYAVTNYDYDLVVPVRGASSRSKARYAVYSHCRKDIPTPLVRWGVRRLSYVEWCDLRRGETLAYDLVTDGYGYSRRFRSWAEMSGIET